MFDEGEQMPESLMFEGELKVNMGRVVLVLAILLLAPVAGAWQLPEQPTIDSE